MPLDKLDDSLRQELDALKTEGRAKIPERVLTEYLPPAAKEAALQAEGIRQRIPPHELQQLPFSLE